MTLQGLNSLIKTFISSIKKFYELKLHLDSSKGYYSSHVGLNMNELKTGEYTAVFELLFPSASIDHYSVDISDTSSIETISRVSINKFADHTRSLVHIHKYNNVTPN